MIRQRVLINGYLVVIVAGALQCATGCGSSDSGPAATGGASAGNGGRAGAGGKAGAGATAGRGGAAPQGGSGGASSAGAPSAGAPSAGAPSAGAPSAGAGGSPACAGILYTHTSAFGSNFDGWDISISGTMPSDLLPNPPAGGTVRELDATTGSPDNGSVKLSIPFFGTNQTLLFARTFPGVNLTGAVVSAQVKLDSGVISAPTDSLTAFLVLKSTTGYIYAPGTPVGLDTTSGWVTLTIGADFPSGQTGVGYTACDIREIDVVIQTGNSGMFKPGVVHIDTIAITNSMAGTGGAGGTDGGGAGGAAGAVSAAVYLPLLE